MHFTHRLLFFCLLCFFVGRLNAQSAEELIKRCDSIYASNPDSSFVLSRNVELLATQSHDTLLLCRAYARNARYLILKSRFEESAEAINKSIELAQASKLTVEEAYATKLKAILQKRIGNLDESIQLKIKSAELYKSVNDADGECNVLLNLSLDYIDRKQFSEAKKALDRVASFTAIMQTNMGYYYHQDFGLLLLAQKDYKGAIAEFEIARPYAKEHKMIDSYVSLLTFIAAAQMGEGDLQKAEKSLEEACKIARENKLDNELDEALVKLTELYIKKGDYQKAYATLHEQSELNRSIYNLERINKINELEKQLQLAEKEKKIAKSQAELEKQTAETERLSAQNIILSLIVGTAIVISLLIAFLLIRTRKLNKQIEGQNKLIQEKSAIIEDAYKNITDSISYSQRIQNAMLPDASLVRSFFSDSFILYKPKDIVSGDFYWFERWGNDILFAAVDCTGHGVPGAFMSIVGHNLLNEAINVHGLSKPNLILNSLSKGITKALRQTQFENKPDDLMISGQVHDGMDIAVCAFNPSTRVLQFAGAYNPVWIVRGTELIELSGDKQSVTAFPGEERKLFTAKEIQLQAGDCIYLFSDGYADQFGGPKGKKFKYAQLKQALMENPTLPMEKKKVQMNDTIENWRGNYEQIDDILLIGIRVS
jgi:serine phosphatase RsbU (regulator of sigma subunit)